MIIIYPYFEECSKYTLDEFWKNIFILCAQNKFPRGAKYDNTTMTISAKNAGTLTLTENPRDNYNAIVEYFRNILNLFSPKDIQIKKSEVQTKINLDCEWKQLKPRSIRDTLLIKYVCDQTNLDIKEKRQLHRTIKLGFQFKELSSDDVDYENGTIRNIRNLAFDEKERLWYTTKTSKITNSSSKNSSSNKFMQSIDKFIREHKSRRLKL